MTYVDHLERAEACIQRALLMSQMDKRDFIDSVIMTALIKTAGEEMDRVDETLPDRGFPEMIPIDECIRRVHDVYAKLDIIIKNTQRRDPSNN